MADGILARLLARARDGHAGRSEAYAWLRARFERLYPPLERRRLTFRQLAEDLAAGGKMGGRGKPLTEDAVRRIWGRVRRDIAAEEPSRMAAAQAALRHGRTARKPGGRGTGRGADADRPPPVVAAPAPRPPVPSHPPSPPPMPAARGATHSRPDAPSDESDRTAQAKAQILRLRRLVAERSGHDPEEIT